MPELIRLAYQVEDYQVSGAPDWFASELYDVDAKAERSAIDEMKKLGNAVFQKRLKHASVFKLGKLALITIAPQVPGENIGFGHLGTYAHELALVDVLRSKSNPTR
jgi:uncharacterized protein DUF3738